MESYDPRKPIIKAKDEEMDEVQGHIRRMLDPEQEPAEAIRFEADGAGDDDQVEGHFRRMLDPDVIARATGDDEDDDPEVEGHLRIR